MKKVYCFNCLFVLQLNLSFLGIWYQCTFTSLTDMRDTKVHLSHFGFGEKDSKKKNLTMEERLLHFYLHLL